MNKRIMLVLCCSSFLYAACGQPPDNTPSKFQRQANIEKYLQKAREANRLVQERGKPLSVSAPADISRLTNKVQETDTSFLERLFVRNRSILEKRLLETYNRQTASQLEALLRKQRQETLALLPNASSPDDLARALRALRQEQNSHWEQFIAAQQGRMRIQPDPKLLEEVHQRLSRRCNEFLDQIAFYYGADSASQCRPVLDKALQDYTAALLTAQDNAALDTSLAQIQKQTLAQMKQITSQAADPLCVTPPEVRASLRSDMIAAHRGVEKQIETLYGKDAVLQAREVFNQCFEEADRVLKENARLSQKKRILAHLNEHYKQSLLVLQKQWNEELKHQQFRPSAYLLSAR